MAETETDQAAKPAAENAPSSARVFLVVVDETPELKLAIRYACLRARKTGGRVAMLHVIHPEETQEWIGGGISRLIRDEARQHAEALMQKMASEVQKLSGGMPVLYFREGDRREEVMKLLSEDPGISILVLGAATGPKGPGPLVQALTSKYIGKLRVPVTIVPGNLSPEDIDHIA